MSRRDINPLIISILTFCAIALIPTSYVFWILADIERTFAALSPTSPFDHSVTPPPPDYSLDTSWAALPQRVDNADIVPPESLARNAQNEARVDVFFIHPTTFFSPWSWNAAADNSFTNLVTDAVFISQQASVFNGTARIFAPRYRQMSIGAFNSSDEDEALNVAYSDIKRAFTHYLQHAGGNRPIIVAGHSQGSRHGYRLLLEFFAKSSLKDRLIAAYLPGMFFPDGPHNTRESDIQICSSSKQTKCIVSWMIFGQSGRGEKWAGSPPATQSYICVNPVSWRSDEEKVLQQWHKGSIPFTGFGGLSKPHYNLIDTQCKDGFLYISEPKKAGYTRMLFPGLNYHLYDYNLVYFDVRDNVAERTKAFLEKSDL